MTSLYAGGERNILVFDDADHGPVLRQAVDAGPMPSFISFAPARGALYAAIEDADGIAQLRQLPDGQLALSSTTAAPGGPAYVAVDGSERWLFAASYGSGELHQFRLDDDGTPRPVRSLRVGKWAHAVVLSPDNRTLHVPCKGDDLVVCFDFDAETGELAARAPWKCPSRSGPRHMLFARGGKRAYVVGENDCTLTSFAFRGDRFEVEATTSTLPRTLMDGDSGADLHLSPDERFLYVSNRGHDSLAVFALGNDPLGNDPLGNDPLELVEIVPARAAIPRNFCVTDEQLWVAGQESRNLARFSRDKVSGRLTHQGDFSADQRIFWVGYAGRPGAR